MLLIFFVKRLKSIQNTHTEKVKTKYIGKNLISFRMKIDKRL